jgi:hypothetical protein
MRSSKCRVLQNYSSHLCLSAMVPAIAEPRRVHTFDELVPVTDLPRGYLQDCNLSPFALVENSPLLPGNRAENPSAEYFWTHDKHRNLSAFVIVFAAVLVMR